VARQGCGRRVEKAYSVYDVPDQEPDAWVVKSTERFVYEGWNVALVLDDENETLRKYTWGLDMSGTTHGAGGIGGLLAAVETQGTETTSDDKKYWFMYDANGNVGQVLDGTNCWNITIAAKYEYDPYGNLISKSGDYADDNPFRFSTKWLDTELAGTAINGAIAPDGLYYFGYRYYSPRLGRWTNEDPIEEEGGANLYQFVLNSPTYRIDPTGEPWYDAYKKIRRRPVNKAQGKPSITRLPASTDCA